MMWANLRVYLLEIKLSVEAGLKVGRDVDCL